jgi:hypothetical protein
MTWPSIGVAPTVGSAASAIVSVSTKKDLSVIKPPDDPTRTPMAQNRKLMEEMSFQRSRQESVVEEPMDSNPN